MTLCIFLSLCNSFAPFLFFTSSELHVYSIADFHFYFKKDIKHNMNFSIDNYVLISVYFSASFHAFSLLVFCKCAKYFTFWCTFDVKWMNWSEQQKYFCWITIESDIAVQTQFLTVISSRAQVLVILAIAICPVHNVRQSAVVVLKLSFANPVWLPLPSSPQV